ncbi:MAG TPA: DUF484 family protein [Oleiagrimonas sp.]|nr:DUF484 family protein [Oleiagrimonas sp.]
MGETGLKDALDATDVADYLRQHPRFLEQFPDLAMALQVPREQGSAASLASYQVDALRRKNRELETRLADLTRMAGNNERLMARVHAFTLGLLAATDSTDALRRVVAGLTEDFHADRVKVMLFDADDARIDADWLVREPKGPSALPALAEFLGADEPLIGRLAQEKLTPLFGAAASEVHSAALIRLGESGILAIGSHDAERFHPGMGGVFLKLIGEAVTTALAHHDGR